MFDSLVVPLFYGAWVVGAYVLAHSTHRRDLIFTARVLVGAWVACNVVVTLGGHDRAPLLIPTIDAILAVICAYIAIFERSRVAAMVLFLFVMIGLVHVAAFQTHTQGTYFYFLVLNLLFFAQVAIVGGAGGWALGPRMADRLHRRDLRSGPHHSGA